MLFNSCYPRSQGRLNSKSILGTTILLKFIISRMTSYKKVNSKALIKPGSELTEDNIYWKKYTPPVLVKEFGPIDYIDFSPVEPYNFAVTCSVRLQVYNPITKLATKTFSKFKEAAYGGCFRKDGQLLCVGGEEAVVRLFNVNTNIMLRRFSGHTAAVHRTFFTSDDVHIASFSDDKTVKLWDIPSEKQVISYNDHKEYIRAGATNPVCPNIILSGGYDKYINMYDVRTNEKVFSVNNDAPVECLLFVPTGGIFLAAGGTDIKVYDTFMRGRLLAKITQHHKTVTCLKTTSNGYRILSGSLDKHVKIYDSSTYNTLHTLDYPNAVLSIGISADSHTIVAGMVDGLISVRKREEDAEDEAKMTRKKQMSCVNENFPRLHIGKQQNVLEVLRKHDACLRKFQYSKALDCVMVSYIVNKHPHITVALMQELIRRQGLKRALSGRDGKSLVNIIKFLNKYIGNIHFGRVMIEVANILLDVYEDHLNELGEESRKMFTIMAQKLQEEIQLMMSLAELYGIIEMTLTSAELAVSTIETSSSAKNNVNIEPSDAAQTEGDLILNIT